MAIILERLNEYRGNRLAAIVRCSSVALLAVVFALAQAALSEQPTPAGKNTKPTDANRASAVEKWTASGDEHLVVVKVPRFGDRGLSLPKADEIATMTGEAYQHLFGLPDTGRFVISEKRYSEVLDLFLPAVVDEYPYPEMVEIGTICITAKNGETRRLCMYWWVPGSRLFFSLNGIRCCHCCLPEDPNDSEHLDEAMVLDELLRKIADEAVAAK